jgi:purine-nucleoside phosphorylase
LSIRAATAEDRQETFEAMVDIALTAAFAG